MTDELQRLRDRVEELEELLGIDDANKLRLKCLGLTGTEAKVLGLLLKRESVTAETLYVALYGARLDHKQPTTHNVISVHLVHLRRKLRRFGIAIETIWGGGWFVKAEDKRKVLAVLVDAGVTVDE